MNIRGASSTLVELENIPVPVDTPAAVRPEGHVTFKIRTVVQPAGGVR